MTRLIDADALHTLFDEKCASECAICTFYDSCKENLYCGLIDLAPTVEERPKGKWVVTAEDNEGIHRIQCPFCRYEKGSDFIDYITVTFEKLPPFCEYCGAEMDVDD